MESCGMEIESGCVFTSGVMKASNLIRIKAADVLSPAKEVICFFPTNLRCLEKEIDIISLTFLLAFSLLVADQPYFL